MTFKKYKSTIFKNNTLNEEEIISKLQNCLTKQDEIGNWLIGSKPDSFGIFQK